VNPIESLLFDSRSVIFMMGYGVVCLLIPVNQVSILVKDAYCTIIRNINASGRLFECSTCSHTITRPKSFHNPHLHQEANINLAVNIRMTNPFLARGAPLYTTLGDVACIVPTVRGSDLLRCYRHTLVLWSKGLRRTGKCVPLCGLPSY